MIVSTICGRLTADPNVTTTSTGKKLATYTVASETQFKDNGDGWVTNFVRVAAFGHLCDRSAKHLKKGSIVTVVGPMAMKSYKAQDKTDRYNLEIRADDVQPGFFEKSGGSSTYTPEKKPRYQKPSQSYDGDDDPFDM